LAMLSVSSEGDTGAPESFESGLAPAV